MTKNTNAQQTFYEMRQEHFVAIFQFQDISSKQSQQYQELE